MNEMSLSRLYRRLTSGPLPHSADIDSMVETLSGDAPDAESATRLSQSATHADLARMLAALRPESEALAQSMARTVAAHPARVRERRAMPAPRRSGNAPLRWVGSLAACLAVALGVGLWHGDRGTAGAWEGTVASATTRYQSDRIFTTRDEIFASSTDATQRKPARGGDSLFKSNFQG